MDWRVKAGFQIFLSSFKIGDKLNHIPVTLNRNYHKHVYQYQSYECIRKVKECNIQIFKDAVALEIGTGYSLISCIILSLFGFDKIITVDITKDISFSSLKKQVKFLSINSLPKEFFIKSRLSRQEIHNKIELIKVSDSFENLLNDLNIIYLAPYTFNELEVICNSYDYITSQVVLEHVKPKQLNLLFENTKKWLKPKGYATHCINFIDHFANPGFFQDKSISEFNFLKYSDKYWKFWAGNPIAYTNRLSYLYYLDLSERSGLKIVAFKGENYREENKFDFNLIHSDIIKKYEKRINIADLMKYQRGTLILSI